MIETTHLSEAMFPELLRKMKENETQSLYALMKNDYNIIPTHHSYNVSMNICDIDNAVLLGIETNSPLLNFSIISKDSNNNVIDTVKVCVELTDVVSMPVSKIADT